MDDHDAVEFALLHCDGRLEFARAADRDSLTHTMREYIPGHSTQGMGRLRAWFTDDFGALPANPLADAVLSGFGYHHPSGWRGPVALTMEELTDEDSPSLTPNARAAIEDLARAR